jgi:hypothetical protein
MRPEVPDANNPNFVLDQAELKDALKAISLMKSEQVPLSSDRCVKPLDNHFICYICSNVVSLDNWECSTCEKLTCRSCIELWVKTKRECPACRASYQPNKKANRFAASTLSDTVFSCQYCQITFKYSDYSSHLAKCSDVQLRCPLKGCTESGTKKEVETHWRTSCKSISLSCKVCKVTFRRGPHAHDCMSYLLTKQADLVAEFSKKEATFLQRLEEKELELLKERKKNEELLSLL